MGVYKVNWDAVEDKQDKCIGVSIVVLDKKGFVIASRTREFYQSCLYVTNRGGSFGSFVCVRIW